MIPKAPAYGQADREEDSDQSCAIDPFAAYPDQESCIDGLGGSEPADDPAYAFATPFFTAAPGPLTLALEFTGFDSADEVNILIELLNRSRVAGSPSMRLNLAIMPSHTLVPGSSFKLPLEIGPNTYYAVHGYIHQRGEMSAAALSITADRPVSSWSTAPRDQSLVANGEHGGGGDGAGAVREAQRITDARRPSFTTPTSQPWTAAQENEPAYLARCRQLERYRTAASQPGWSEAFVLQAATFYGALVDGARGVGFKAADQALAMALVEHGHGILLTNTLDRPDEHVDLGRRLLEVRENARPIADLGELVDFTIVPPDAVGGDFAQFDFGWWIAPADVDIHDARQGMAALLAAVVPGGMAIVVLPWTPGSTPDNRTDAGLYRGDLERLAIEAISFGHAVAQMRFGDTAVTGATMPFGLILRRGNSG